MFNGCKDILVVQERFPIPISTILDNGSPRSSPRRFTATTWSKISSGNRFRVNPNPPVAQKLHFSLHPTCEETHTVDLSLLGISTVSIKFPSGRVKPSFVVPSLLSCLWVSVAACNGKVVVQEYSELFWQVGSCPRNGSLLLPKPLQFVLPGMLFPRVVRGRLLTLVTCTLLYSFFPCHRFFRCKNTTRKW